MSQAKQIVQFNSFVAGLITEATELTYPPNSSFDEENCVLSVKGNRRRRLGIDFEEDYVLSTFGLTDAQLTEGQAIYSFNWSAVGGKGTRNFVMVQLGKTLYFYDLASTPISSGLKGFTVNLDTHLAPSASTAALDRVSCVVGRGDLFVVSPSIKPLQITYNEDLETITVVETEIRIRDFDGVNDGLKVDAEQASLSVLHHYNLLNQGWFATPEGMDPLAVFKSESGVYPANNIQWFLFKKVTGARRSSGTGSWNSTEGGEPDTKSIRLLSVGTTQAPQGHYILDPFYKEERKEVVVNIGDEGINLLELRQAPRPHHRLRSHEGIVHRPIVIMYSTNHAFPVTVHFR